MNLSIIASTTALTADRGTSQTSMAVAAKAMAAERLAGAGILKLLSVATGRPASTTDVNGIGGTLDLIG